VYLWLRASTLPCYISVLASVITPLAAQQICESTSNIFSILYGTIKVEFNLLYTANTTPSGTFNPTAELPN
jgi:hypothetical protein